MLGTLDKPPTPEARMTSISKECEHLLFVFPTCPGIIGRLCTGLSESCQGDCPRERRPSGPVDLIRTEIIEAAGLTLTAAAIALRVSRPTLSSLLNGKADLSEDMALRIEKAFGVKMDTLMRMQSSYDIAQTRKRENQIRVPRISVLATTH